MRKILLFSILTLCFVLVLSSLSMAQSSRSSSWKTNFDIKSIDLREITRLLPRDAIPAIGNPRFVSFDNADQWVKDVEPVVSFENNGVAKAYPLQILTWHEIVNDEVGGAPVSVTFCPLCNSAIVFDRLLDGVVYDFGTSGNLRNSDLVMYDRQTESWWQQLIGEAIVGDLTGKKLKMLPAPLISYGDFKETYPDGIVLSRDTGYSRRYGMNPYRGYDDINKSPFLMMSPVDDRLPAMERIVAVAIGETDKAYPFSILTEEGAVNDSINGTDVVILHSFGTASALDSDYIAASKDVGATGVFKPYVDGRKLTFVKAGDEIKDNETGSTWNILGIATSGPLAGKSLEPIVHANHFAFAWFAFKPDTLIYNTSS